ncbi:MAG: hypothetical protein IPI73_23825 [Betaproteobacteria bacterium]|nr:hypothetical protein [Betaproteobacteria bacterium]
MFMKAPALLLPGAIAASKATVATLTFAAEKAVSSDQLSSQGAFGFFAFSFCFEFAYATIGANVMSGRAAAAVRDRLANIVKKVNVGEVSDEVAEVLVRAGNELKNLDVLSELGLFHAFAQGGLYKLAPRTVREIVFATTEAIQWNVPGLPAAIDGVLELGEELFN